LISPVAKSHQPLWKWLEGAAPAVGAALMIANLDPATAQQWEAPQRTEIAIPMNDQGIRAAGILTARVSPAQGRSDLSFPGTVMIPQQQIRVIATPAGGIVEALMVGQDEPVVAGQVVAQVRSPDLVEAQRLYLAAISDDALASDKLRRARLLFEGKAAPERDLRIAESEAAVNKAKLDERTQLLFLIGMDKTEFETLQSSRMIASALTLRSPVNGTVVTRHVGVGEQIKAAAPLFTLGLLDPLHVNIQVPAQRLSTIDVGAHVSIPAYRVEGRIIRIGRTVDQATHGDRGRRGQIGGRASAPRTCRRCPHCCRTSCSAGREHQLDCSRRLSCAAPGSILGLPASSRGISRYSGSGSQ
jgi:cobalt-zinc-cadmium efflux system membrane fusion protein